MIPSLGRGAADFDLLAATLRQNNYSTLALGARVEPMDGEQTFEDLADDVARLCANCGATPRFLIGHAYGQALARCIVARHPGLFDAVVLLACGSSMPAEDVRQSLEAATDPVLLRTNPAQHLTHVSRAFFAPGNDASVWADGWYPNVARVEMQVISRTPFERWRSVDVDQILVIQGLQDAIAPPEHGRSFISEQPAARLIEVEGAGHALLPEQPALISGAIVSFIDETARLRRRES